MGKQQLYKQQSVQPQEQRLYNISPTLEPGVSLNGNRLIIVLQSSFFKENSIFERVMSRDLYLGLGSIDDAIIKVKAALNYIIENEVTTLKNPHKQQLEINTIFDKKTEQIVKLFQSQYMGMKTPDGIIGHETLYALDKIISKKEITETEKRKKSTNIGIPNINTRTRNLISNTSNNIKVEEKPTYTLEQTAEEFWASNSKTSYEWSVKDYKNNKIFNIISNKNTFQYKSFYPGKFTICVQLINNGQKIAHHYYEYNQNVYQKNENTELGKLSVGNFDFNFDGFKVDVIVKVKFLFEDTISNLNQIAFKNKFFDAIKISWGSHGKYIEQIEEDGSILKIPINIMCIEVSDNSYHKIVDVEKDARRPKVISDINVYLSISKQTIAHEFGHVLGLYDEYDGGFIENSMFWHDDNNNQQDINALMNNGGQMRDRYFEHYKDKVQEVMPKTKKYSIK